MRELGQALYCVLFLAPALFIPAYYLALVALRVGGLKAVCPESARHEHSFAIVIPAHNEEMSLPDALQSCQRLAYPEDKYELFVVADNCADATAEIARRYGATCLERNDPSRPGKGWALHWGFQHVLKKAHDAVVVLDADCQIDDHALRVFDQCVQEGSQALQSNHVTSNCDAGPLSYVARVGQLLEYDYAYAPKSCLRLAVPLVGTGMVFDREILQQHPWDVGSVVEDIEYTLLLAKKGIPVRFVGNVAVRHKSEERLDQLRIQRRRWANGALRLGRGRAFRLLLEGLVTGRLLIADAGWTLLTMSRPLILLHAGLTVVLAGLLALTNPDGPGWVLLALAGLAAFAHVVYYSIGVAVLGLNARRVWLLLAAPLVVARLAVISLRSLFTVREPQWERTPR